MKTLLEMVYEALNGGSPDKLIAIAKQFDSLHDNARFLSAMGTPIQSNKDFQRAYKKALREIHKALLAIKQTSETGEEFEISSLSQEDKYLAKDLAKKFAIRPLWLLEDLE